MAQAHITSSYLYVRKRTTSIRLIYLTIYTYILFKSCALNVSVWWQVTTLTLWSSHIEWSFCGECVYRASQDARIENNIGRVSMNKICTTEMLMPYFNQKCTYLFILRIPTMKVAYVRTCALYLKYQNWWLLETGCFRFKQVR